MHVGIKRKHSHDDGIIDGIKILASFKWRIPLLNYQCEIATTSIYTNVNKGKKTDSLCDMRNLFVAWVVHHHNIDDSLAPASTGAQTRMTEAPYNQLRTWKENVKPLLWNCKGIYKLLPVQEL